MKKKVTKVTPIKKEADEARPLDGVEIILRHRLDAAVAAEDADAAATLLYQIRQLELTHTIAAAPAPAPAPEETGEDANSDSFTPEELEFVSQKKKGLHWDKTQKYLAVVINRIQRRNDLAFNTTNPAAACVVIFYNLQGKQSSLATAISNKDEKNIPQNTDIAERLIHRLVCEHNAESGSTLPPFDSTNSPQAPRHKGYGSSTFLKTFLN